MEESRETADQGNGLVIGVLVGFLVCLVIVGFARTNKGRNLLTGLQTRVSDAGVKSARNRVPESLRSSAAGGRNAISAGRDKVASAINRSPLPVSFGDQEPLPSEDE